MRYLPAAVVFAAVTFSISNAASNRFEVVRINGIYITVLDTTFGNVFLCDYAGEVGADGIKFGVYNLYCSKLRLPD